MKFLSTKRSEKLTQWALPIGIIAGWQALSLAGLIPAAHSAGADCRDRGRMACDNLRVNCRAIFG